jgi:hypothetical protein
VKETDSQIVPAIVTAEWPDGASFDAKTPRIEDPAEVQEKFAEALAYRGPVLIDAVVNRLELAMPPNVTAEMARASNSARRISTPCANNGSY